jgi:3',5'-cyclic AMP phosphodiesterase CpdA
MFETPPFSPLLSRRRCLQLGALGAMAAPLAARAAPSTTTDSRRKRVVRFAHLTDLHIQPELAAAAGTAKCLQHVQSLEDPAELIVTGGDVVMDVFEADAARSDLLARLWKSTLSAECSLPVRSAIGNHDIRPWGPDPTGMAAKRWALDLLGINARYYAFDQAGWRFIILDTVQPDGDGYSAFLDDEQRSWLEGELDALAGSRPVAVVSHIPILSVTTFTYPRDDDGVVDGAIQVPDSWMLRDARSVHGLLRRQGNVKLCLSGHMHLADRCEIDGVTYICGGAVSANWWEGPLEGVDEGYGLVDLYDDGSFDYAYTSYGWDAAQK